MIKVCKNKAVERWTKICHGAWYAWNLSFIVSIVIPLISLSMGSFTNYDFVLVVNAIFSGIFMIGNTTIFTLIKEKQKLFGWNEDC